MIREHAPSYAASAAQMTPPADLKACAKTLALRGVLDRLRPLAYRKATDTIRCLTFHYLFPQEREHAARLFAALKREGDFITTDELLATLDGPARRRGRLFHLSIDDGFENIASEAHPILRAQNIPYALMVCPTFVGEAPNAFETFRRNARYAKSLPLADWTALARLAREGVEIGAHTLTHRQVSSLPAGEIEAEVAGCRAAIERRLKAPCTSFAWPFGRTSSMSEEALRVATTAGYRAIFSSVRGSMAPGDGVPRYLPRHHFEPGWPIRTVLYYATRAERPFVPPPLVN
ncbi:polysaccharide deacetylase family protein [Methylobacterium sp. J-068]|uniref:polysaccharide deacetylase family protein n=1 Tax=Methylobacterium sp. J-068 TaxID=2836649 RepID=UPI001FB8D3BD|nr:polysaccharide deacetylase family protein [Methylobacterium sp. J-068]MCJ2033486.1 polysaccharide deacetylase family protein [Methylobacterium sp. J-068]